MRVWRGVVLLALLPATLASAHVRQGSGGGPPGPEPSGVCLSEEKRREIRRIIDENIARLQEQGNLPTVPSTAANPALEWPLRSSPAMRDFSHYSIEFYVDQDPTSGVLLDYNCDVRTYDGHHGSDYDNWPFYWLKMDEMHVEIVAAAPGTIVHREDGHYDRRCDWSGYNWNAIIIRHADGSEAWYGHMKNGSVTPKSVGEEVERGEYLGIVGSSGNSTWPHLHFEIYDSYGALNDPYEGPCNSLNANSWWASRPPYHDSMLNRLGTGYAEPVFPPCPEQERPNEAKDFNFGDTHYVMAYYRDQLGSQTTTYTVYRPDGSVAETWDHNSPSPHLTKSTWYWVEENFAPDGPAGVWRVTAQYEGHIYETLFRMGPLTGSGRVPGQLNELDKLTVRKSGPQLTLTWPESCVSTDSDYEVYEGTTGIWYSHYFKLCTTQESTSATFSPTEGNTYYLVVPTDTTVEGSYGIDSLRGERPPGDPSCRPQQIGGRCPKCGDGIREGPEICDGDDLNGETCQSQGFDHGALSCSVTCDSFDTSTCSTSCGNNVCEALGGENCTNCESDCNGVQTGNPGGRYCCGDGGGYNPISCDDPRCTAGGNTCVD